MRNRVLLGLAITWIVVGVGWWLWPYLRSASSQAAHQHERLVQAAAHRNWPHVTELLAADYHDAWNQNRAEALESAQEVLGPYLMLDLDWTTQSIVVDEKRATITGLMRLHGSGPSGISTISDRVNQIQKPWTFVWRKDGSSPDDWHLISVSNPEVEHLTP